MTRAGRFTHASSSTIVRKLRVGIVSIFPDGDEKHGLSGGVASYTRNLIEALGRAGLVEPIVFANQTDLGLERFDTTIGKIEPGNIELHRCWHRGSRFVS